MHVPSVLPFFVPFKNGFGAFLWCHLHLTLDRSKVPLTKMVFLPVHVNEALQLLMKRILDIMGMHCDYERKIYIHFYHCFHKLIAHTAYIIVALSTRKEGLLPKSVAIIKFHNFFVSFINRYLTQHITVYLLRVTTTTSSNHNTNNNNQQNLPVIQKTSSEQK